MLFTSLTAVFAVFILSNAEPTPNTKGNVDKAFWLRVVVQRDVYIVLMRLIDLGGPGRSIFSNRWTRCAVLVRGSFICKIMTFCLAKNRF